jgi:bifunctional DNase/RNase
VVDSIRVAAACPELTLILRPKDVDSYLPIWISPSQAEILADQLHGRPDKDAELDLFLANSNAASADIRGTVIHLEGATFHATILLSQHGRDYEAECPIGIALALACRANAPILVDEALFDRAGVRPA